MLGGIKRIFGSGSGIRRRDVHRTAELFGERRQIQSMQAVMKTLVRILRLGNQENHSMGT